MQEKIKISLPKDVAELIKKDCLDFQFVKANGASNQNAFINRLVVNYYEVFSASEERVRAEIKEALAAVPQYYQEDALKKVLKVFGAREVENARGKSVTLSFKPNKNCERAVEYIEHILSKDESLSSFYRRMFCSYAQKRKDEREKIICRENYELLQQALQKGVKVCISILSGKFIEGASVYAVAAAKDELFNYILYYDGKNNCTLHLSKLKSITLLAEKSQIPERNEGLFARQAAIAPQYTMYPSDRELIRVKISEQGKKLFNRIYLYRPAPVSIEGDIYTFDCSANQLLYYFERFGERAVILSPKRLGVFMRNYYYFAYKKYRDVYKKD